MPILFSKYHGLGNDFVVIDAVADASLASLDFGRLAPAWCDRNTGVGADGVLVLTRETGVAHVRMRIVNADGSDGGMCGNGLRCVAKHMVERHAWPDPELRIRVGDAVLPVQLDVAESEFISATVDMGEARTSPEAVPVRITGEHAVGVQLPADVELPRGIEPAMTCVNVGNPHAVLFCDDAAGVPLESLGPQLEVHPIFPARTNVQFVQVLSRDRIRVRTWERGAGATLACGTGACAAVMAGVLTHRLSHEAAVELPGGELSIRVDGRRVFMTGPATHVFDGVIS